VLDKNGMTAHRANTLVVDVALLGSGAENCLVELCARRRDLAVIVCTGPSTVRSADAIKSFSSSIAAHPATA
jgi:hypothetical protein